MTAVDSRVIYNAFNSYWRFPNTYALPLTADELLYLEAAYEELEKVMQFAFEQGTDKIIVNLPSNDDFLAGICSAQPIDCQVVLNVWQKIRRHLPVSAQFDHDMQIDETNPVAFLITFEQAQYLYELAGEHKRRRLAT